MQLIPISNLARVAALAALALPLTAQVTFTGLGTSIPGLRVADISSDGSAMVASDGTSIYLRTSANPTFVVVGVSAGYDFDVSNGGTYICATIPDPSNNNAETAARLTVATGQWTFLGGLGGQSGTSLSSAYDMSADGQAIVGLGWITAQRAHAFRWDPVNGMLDLGSMPGNPHSSRADAISADGTTITGWDEDPNTGVWRAAKWVNTVESLLGCLDPSDPINGPSQGYAVSSDGAYIVGESATGLYTPSYWSEMHAFRWDAINGMLDLGTTPVDPFGWGNHDTFPTAVSTDGRTVVGLSGAGFGGQTAFISHHGSPMQPLQDFLLAMGASNAANWFFSDIAGMSADGRVICGSAYNASFQTEPYLITLPANAETYCVAKVNSLGCTPAISATGIASATSSLPFTVGASNVLNNKTGLVFYGLGALNNPFQGGTKCVSSPSFRTPTQNSSGAPSGNSCTGAYSFDFNALIQASTNPQLTVGAKVYCQYWSRDPLSPSTTGLTNAASFTIFP